jgi:hypothetical protein
MGGVSFQVNGGFRGGERHEWREDFGSKWFFYGIVIIL